MAAVLAATSLIVREHAVAGIGAYEVYQQFGLFSMMDMMYINKIQITGSLSDEKTTDFCRFGCIGSWTVASSGVVRSKQN
jgi:hypothetical protein